MFFLVLRLRLESTSLIDLLFKTRIAITQFESNDLGNFEYSKVNHYRATIEEVLLFPSYN